MKLIDIPIIGSYLGLWMMLMQLAIMALAVIILGHVTEWKKFIPFIFRETPESVEQKLASFDESIFAQIIMTEEGIVTSANKQSEILFGFSEAEFKKDNLSGIMPEGYLSKHIEGLKREKGKQTADKKYLLPALKKDGTQFSIELYLRKRSIGNKCYYVGKALDVTGQQEEKKKLENEIKRLKFKLSIVDKGEEISQMSSWTWNIKSGEVTASDGYKRITHLDFGDYCQVEKVKPNVWDADREILNTALYNATVEGKGYEITYRQIRIDDLQVIHLRSIGKVEKNEDGIPVFLHESTKLEKVTSIREAEKY